jgi:hypothetical protein
MLSKWAQTLNVVKAIVIAMILITLSCRAVAGTTFDIFLLWKFHVVRMVILMEMET